MMNPNRSRRGSINTTEHIKQGTLSTPRWSHNGNELPFMNFQINLLNYFNFFSTILKTFSQVFCFNYLFHINLPFKYDTPLNYSHLCLMNPIICITNHKEVVKGSPPYSKRRLSTIFIR